LTALLGLPRPPVDQGLFPVREAHERPPAGRPARSAPACGAEPALSLLSPLPSAGSPLSACEPRRFSRPDLLRLRVPWCRPIPSRSAGPAGTPPVFFLKEKRKGAALRNRPDLASSIDARTSSTEAPVLGPPTRAPLVPTAGGQKNLQRESGADHGCRWVWSAGGPLRDVVPGRRNQLLALGAIASTSACLNLGVDREPRRAATVNSPEAECAHRPGPCSFRGGSSLPSEACRGPKAIPPKAPSPGRGVRGPPVEGGQSQRKRLPSPRSRGR